jgi:hypothetical protein
MKNILMGCVFLMAAGILPAQDQFNLEFTVKTPFAVSGATLPAGTYNIRLVDRDENIFECAGKSGSPSVLFEADPHEIVPTTTGVTFAKYGDKLVLKNISIAGDQGYWIATSIPEKRQKKGGVKPTAVTTAATKK